LAARRLPAALGIGAAALLRKALMTSGLRRVQLSATGTLQTSSAETPDWLGTLDSLLGDAASRLGPTATSTIEHEIDAYFAGALATVRGDGTSLLAKTGGVRSVLLEALSRSLETSCAAFRSDEDDAPARDAMTGWGQGRLAFAGHTHAARKLCATRGHGVYINTGTWIEQVPPPIGMPAEELPDWLDRLRLGQVPLWNGYPVAMVDALGPSLRSWDGEALRAWVDPVKPAAA
jgi:hypothetical protein